MIIIADSGSTQCTWLATDGSHTERLRTEGINALQHTQEHIRGILLRLPDWKGVREVHFYGAGCGGQFPETTKRLGKMLAERFGAEVNDIASDLLGSARALFGRGEGIACILGTGSNSCLCRRGEIVQNVPPLGYVLGDEGSGAALGRNLLNGVLKGHIPLQEELFAACGTDYEGIIRRVYAEPRANRFLASLAPFVREHLDMPEVRQMVSESFREFARRNLRAYPPGLPLSFTGGIAAHFKETLREAMLACGRKVTEIVESPAEGLLKYHYGK